jgi:hypothetical protein
VSAARTHALRWWGVQLALNAAWTSLFFGLRAPRLALVDLSALLLVFGVILDATASGRSPATQRKKQADWTKQHENLLRQYSHAAGLSAPL